MAFDIDEEKISNFKDFYLCTSILSINDWAIYFDNY